MSFIKKITARFTGILDDIEWEKFKREIYATIDSITGTVPGGHHASHENGGSDEIGVGGLSGTLADAQTPVTHHARHENGGDDEISVAGLSGLLADAQTPSAHASTHETGGADEIIPPYAYKELLATGNVAKADTLCKVTTGTGTNLTLHAATIRATHYFYCTNANNPFVVAAGSDTFVGVTPNTHIVLEQDKPVMIQSDGVSKWYIIARCNANGVYGVTDHGALTGLSDDDHTQYVVPTRTPTTDNQLAKFSGTGGRTITNTTTTDDGSTVDFQAKNLKTTGNVNVGNPTVTGKINTCTGSPTQVGRMVEGFEIPEIPAGGISPSDISGLTLWMKADQLSLNDGDPVSTWTDQSSNHLSFAQGTAGAKPTYKTNIVNGKPAVLFDGGDFLTSDSVPYSTLYPQNCQQTMFIIMNNTSPTSGETGSRAFYWGHEAWGDGMYVAYYCYYSGTAYFDNGSGRVSGAIPGGWLDNWHTVILKKNSSNYQSISIDGSVIANLSSDASFSTNTAYPAMIGTFFSKYYIGYIAEIIIFNKPLSSQELSDMGTYLNNKYFVSGGGVTPAVPQSADLDRFYDKAGGTKVAHISPDGTINTVKQFKSTLAIGTKPIDVTSTTVCTNLNADMVDGVHVTGTNTGDNSANSLYSGLAGSKAETNQAMYIGTTATTINRASAAQTLTGITLTSPVFDTILDGWISAGETLTCGATNTLTASAGFVTNLSIGDKVAFLDDGVQSYGYVLTKPTGTTFTITMAQPTAQTTLASASTITVPQYSKQFSPTGFPLWINYTPTCTGGGGSAGTYAQGLSYARFRILGDMCEVSLNLDITNKGSWSGDTRVSLPLAIVSPAQNIAISGFGFTRKGDDHTQVGMSGGNVTYIKFNYSLGASIMQWSDFNATSNISGTMLYVY